MPFFIRSWIPFSKEVRVVALRGSGGGMSKLGYITCIFIDVYQTKCRGIPHLSYRVSCYQLDRKSELKKKLIYCQALLSSVVCGVTFTFEGLRIFIVRLGYIYFQCIYFVANFSAYIAVFFEV